MEPITNDIKSPAPKPTLTFWALEGIHGIGKTTLINKLKDAGYTTFSELFSDLLPKDKKLTPYDLMFAETRWQWEYFARVDAFCEAYENDQVPQPKGNIVFIDRSYFTSALYTNDRNYEKLLIGMGRGLVTALTEKRQIKFKILYLERPIDEHYYGLLSLRLTNEPWRKQLRETDRDRIAEFCLKARCLPYDFYWDRTLLFDKYGDLDEEIEEILQIVNDTD